MREYNWLSRNKLRIELLTLEIEQNNLEKSYCKYLNERISNLKKESEALEKIKDIDAYVKENASKENAPKEFIPALDKTLMRIYWCEDKAEGTQLYGEDLELFREKEKKIAKQKGY